MTVNEACFDPDRLTLHRRRARHMARDDAAFLIERASAELADRLAATNRQFVDGIDLLTPIPVLADTLRPLRPGLDLRHVDHETLAPADLASGDLRLEPEAHDLAVSIFGLHWTNDLPGALAQIRRTLRPDGLFMATLPGEGTLSELRSCLIEAESELSSGAADRIDPFVEIRQAGSLLQRAGFALPVADSEELVVRYRSVAALIADLRAMAATSARAGTVRPLPRGILATLEAVYAKRFADPDGRLRATFNFIHLTGWAPHESQQQPLKPGSAQVRLADFLNRRNEVN